MEQPMIFDGMDDAYHRIFDIIKQAGKLYTPRGKSCFELRPANLIFKSPEMTLYSGVSRRLNYRFYAIETLCYIAGIFGEQHARLINAVNPNMKFSMNMTTQQYDGAYGRAFDTAIGRTYDELMDDINSRRAYISIWEHEQNMQSLDVPCTTGMQFFLDTGDNGDQMLSAITTMRSNDINWGLPYDVPAFCAIHILLARALQLNIGYYYHNVGSLHYYEDTGAEGGKPPTIKHPEHEKWTTMLGANQLYVPVPPDGCNIYKVINNALHMMDELDTHLNTGLKIADFYFKTNDITLQEYFNDWLYLLHWNWKEYV